MIFKNILEILEQELERRTERAKQNFSLYLQIEKENKKLKKENEMLRKDLQELSKEYIKNKK